MSRVTIDISKVEESLPLRPGKWEWSVVLTDAVKGKVEDVTAPFSVTELILASPALLASLERAIERLEPGKLLTNEDIFGDEDESAAE